MNNKRESLKQAGLTLVKEYKNEIIVRDENGENELWGKSDGFSGYALRYKGNDYEFITTVKKNPGTYPPKVGQKVYGYCPKCKEDRELKITSKDPMTFEFSYKCDRGHRFTEESRRKRNPKHLLPKVSKFSSKPKMLPLLVIGGILWLIARR